MGQQPTFNPSISMQDLGGNPLDIQRQSTSVNTPKGVAGTTTPSLANTNNLRGMNEAWQKADAHRMNTTTDIALKERADYEAYKDTIPGMAEPYIKNASALIGGVASLASIYTGLETLKLQKKADSRADEVWAMQKEELSAVRAVRSKNESRMAEMEADPNSMYYRA